MPGGIDLGAYYVSVVPKFSAAGGALSSALAPEIGAVGASAEKSLAGGIASGAATGSKAAVGSVGSVSKAVLGIGAAFAASKFVTGAVEAGEARNKAAAQTNAVIASTGGAAKVSAGEVGKLAASLADMSGTPTSAIRDAENRLLTFAKVVNQPGKGNDIFTRTTKTALDMAVAMKTSVPDAAQTLGFAMNDPIAGLTRLRRTGISFTAEQKDQVKAMVASGNQMGAQKIILDELAKKFGGSAAAQATASGKLRVEWARLQSSIGVGLLPVVDKLATAGGAVVSVLSHLPAPLAAASVLAVGGGAAYALFGGAIRKVWANIEIMSGALTKYLPSSASSTAATEANTAAFVEEAAAADGAAASVTAAGTASAAAGAESAAGGAAAAAGAGEAAAGTGLLAGGVSGLLGPIALAGAAMYGVGKVGSIWLDSISGSVPPVQDLTTALTELAKSGKEVGAVADLGGIDGIVGKVKQFHSETTGVNSALNTTADNLTKWIPYVGGKGRLAALNKQLDNVDNGLAAMVTSGNGAAAAAIFTHISTQAEKAGVPVKDINNDFNDYQDAVKQAAGSTDKLATSTTTVTKAFADAVMKESPYTTALNDQATAAKTATDNLHAVGQAAKDALGIKQSVPAAQDAQASAQSSFTDALQAARAGGYTGDWMKDNSQTARDLRDKYRTLQSATADLMQAWSDAGVQGDDLKNKVNGLGTSFADTKNVYVGKSAIDDYTGSLQLMLTAMQNVQAQQQLMYNSQLADLYNAGKPLGQQHDPQGNLKYPMGPAPVGPVTGMPGLGGTINNIPNARASGGPVMAGSQYRINEHGTESYFTPQGDGFILDADKTKQLVGAGAPTFHVYETANARSTAIEIEALNAWNRTGRDR